jgi:hypothetical protein
MKLWVTSLRAIDPRTGELKRWCGPHVPGITHKHAEQYCQENGLGYCVVVGELIAEVETKPNSIEPDWSTYVDYEKKNLN